MDQPLSGLFLPAVLWRRINILPRFFIKWWQLRALKLVISEAYHHVPFYNKLFRESGIRPEDIKTLDDIQRLPIISKKLLKQYPIDEITNNRLPPGSYHLGQTSGSMGEPFRFRASHSFFLWDDTNIFSWYRFLIWRGIKFQYIRNVMKAVHIGIHPRGRYDENYLFIPTADLRENSGSAMSRIHDFAPDIIEGTSTMLVEFARLAEDVAPDNRPHFQYAASYGEILTPSQRKFVECSFGCEVYNLYGAEEIGAIGIECKAHDGFHTCDEKMLVEVVDENGKNVPRGVTGRIVVTGFYNIAMSFIRYEVGDDGLIMPEACQCGLQTPRLQILGRQGGVLTIGTTRFNHIEFSIVMGDFNELILRYQIAKVDENTLEIRIIPARNIVPRDIEYLQTRFKKEFGLEPRVKIVEEITYTAGNKTPVVIDETKTV